MADWLDVPTHVLRFWESRFSQIKPVKRAGGRRYYRPSDMRVIGGVKVLLHDQGMTIRGVQKLFREEGIKHVSGYAPELFGEEDADEAASVLNEEALQLAARPAPAARSTREAAPDPEVASEPESDTPDEAAADPGPADAPDVVFRRRTTPVAPAPEDGAPDGSAEGELPLEEPAAAAPAIPATPDVPATDPDDDSDAHRRDPGIAARLRIAAPETLVAHREVLVAAAERLRALADRPD